MTGAPLDRLRASLRFDGLWWRKFAYLGCVYGPDWWKRHSPPAIAAIIFLLVGRNRRGAMVNLARVLGDPGRRRLTQATLGMYAQFAHCMTETMECYGPRPHPLRIDVASDDDLEHALRAGRGAIVVTGHFGNWDVAAKMIQSYGRPMNVVMAREANATTHEFVRAAREQAGVRVIYSDTSVFSSINIVRALRENEIVAIQLDRPMGTGGTRDIEFFGAPAAFSTGPFVLARLTGAPIVPVFVPRLGVRRYRVCVRGRFSVARDDRSLDGTMLPVVRAFEEVVREFPTQWFQFSPFWPAAAAPAAQTPAATPRPARTAAYR